ncbi:MAG: transposase, partial [Candidatus Methylomirabilales bacterium]
VATFDTPQQSSDGGAILLKAIDDELGLTSRLAACIPEWRQPGKIEQDVPTLIRHCCFGLACGYPDANRPPQGRPDPPQKRVASIQAASSCVRAAVHPTVFVLQSCTPPGWCRRAPATALRGWAS